MEYFMWMISFSDEHTQCMYILKSRDSFEIIIEKNFNIIEIILTVYYIGSLNIVLFYIFVLLLFIT